MYTQTCFIYVMYTQTCFLFHLRHTDADQSAVNVLIIKVIT